MSVRWKKRYDPTKKGTRGVLWYFVFDALASNDDYTLHVKDDDTGEEDATVVFHVIPPMAALVSYYYPANDGDSVTQTFCAWGLTDSALVGNQTMTGNGVPPTPGTPSPVGGSYWAVTFDIVNPQNPYVCTITNGTGPNPRRNLQVQANPPT
jgi:hypothetical protein